MFKNLVLVALSVTALSAQATSNEELANYLTIASVTTTVETTTTEGVSKSVMEKSIDDNVLFQDEIPGIPNADGSPSTASKVGEVIAVGKELVALGEQVYELVKKGKPTLKLEYAPISIIPKVNGAESVDVMSTENWKMPITRRYKLEYKNLYGIKVITYEYMVLFSYGGTFDGKGAYITAAQIIPNKVTVLWGFDFDSNMKLAGIQNFGSAANPIAGALLTIQYRASSILKLEDTSDTFQLTGQGYLQQL